jgi:hypothetical protein
MQENLELNPTVLYTQGQTTIRTRSACTDHLGERTVERSMTDRKQAPRTIHTIN